MLMSSATAKKASPAFDVGFGIMALFALLVIVTNWSTAAFAQAGAEGEALSPSDFLRQYRDELNRQMVRYHDARVDGKISGRMDRPRINRSKKASQDKSTTQPRTEPARGSLSFSLIRSGVNEKLNFIRTGRNPADRVVVTAGSHAFRVYRGTPGGPYMLSLSETKNEGDEGFKMTEKLRPRVLDAVYSPAGLLEFPAYVMDPQFEVKQVTRTMDSGSPAI